MFTFIIIEMNFRVVFENDNLIVTYNYEGLMAELEEIRVRHDQKEERRVNALVAFFKSINEQKEKAKERARERRMAKKQLFM
jgi:hypothetical protein